MEISDKLELELQLTNRCIDRLLHSENPTMQEVMEWILQSRGKQLRPILVILSASISGKHVNKEELAEVAAVIEICHTASLIHDDIIDHSDLRRAQLSVQKKYGSEMAVYAGDYMIFAAIGRTRLMNKPWYRQMFKELEVMCNGEVNQYAKQYDTSITSDEYLDNIKGKTSAMFKIACGSGAHEGECSSNQIYSLEQFAEYFGIMFQLRDDLLNYISNTSIEKKNVHSDFYSGYYNLPAIKCFSSESGSRLKDIAKITRDVSDPHSYDDEVYELIEKSDGFNYTKKLIDKFAKLALDSLSEFENNFAKNKLCSLVDNLIDGL